MRARRLSMVAVLLAAGCAHGKSEASTARSSNEGRTAREAQRAEREEERVEVPRREEERRRMASAGEQLPEQGTAHEPARAESFGASPDNTRVNERDREKSALTPLDQGESETDRELTQQIRKAVITEDSLSFTAKNVKIISRDGQVTLRGPVNNAAERDTIERLAREYAGSAKVTNQLEISE